MFLHLTILNDFIPPWIDGSNIMFTYTPDKESLKEHYGTIHKGEETPKGKFDFKRLQM